MACFVDEVAEASRLRFGRMICGKSCILGPEARRLRHFAKPRSTSESRTILGLFSVGVWRQYYGVIHPACFSTVFDVEIPSGGLPANWALVTAFARTGTVRRFAEDESADARLAAELDKLGLLRWRVTGRSPAGDHAEPGRGVACELAVARDIGQQFDQAAIFWIIDGILWVGECGVGVSGARVGPLAPKLNPPVIGLGGDAKFLKFAGTDPVRRAALLRFLGAPEVRAANFQTLMREADESSYSPYEWCSVAAEFQNLLEWDNRTSDFEKKLGYLHCCADAARSAPNALKPDLADTFASLWSQYGYAG